MLYFLLMSSGYMIYTSIEDFVEFVVPELQARGIYKKEYAAGTYQEKFMRNREEFIRSKPYLSPYRKGVSVE